MRWRRQLGEELVGALDLVGARHQPCEQVDIVASAQCGLKAFGGLDATALQKREHGLRQPFRSSFCTSFRTSVRTSDDDFVQNESRLEVPLLAGQTVTVVVDGFEPNEQGNFQLTISEAEPAVCEAQEILVGVWWTYPGPRLIPLPYDRSRQ